MKKLAPIVLIMVLVCSALILNAPNTHSSVSALAQENTDDMTIDSIKFNNGKLKIMHVADTHLKYGMRVDETLWLIGVACDRENPDMVVLTGDNLFNYDDPNETKKLINQLMTVFNSRNIPVAVTFGNHDSERGAMSRDELLDYYNTFSCSVSKDVKELSGCGTYNVPILSSEGDKVAFNLWVFDSGDYDEEERYSAVKEDQIEWYKQTSNLLQEQNNGEKVNSLVFQHIIVPEIYDALVKTNSPISAFSYKHIYNKGEYYIFTYFAKESSTICSYVYASVSSSFSTSQAFTRLICSSVGTAFAVKLGVGYVAAKFSGTLAHSNANARYLSGFALISSMASL